jgi:hypothetical protein
LLVVAVERKEAEAAGVEEVVKGGVSEAQPEAEVLLEGLAWVVEEGERRGEKEEEAQTLRAEEAEGVLEEEGSDEGVREGKAEAEGEELGREEGESPALSEGEDCCEGVRAELVEGEEEAVPAARVTVTAVEAVAEGEELSLEEGLALAGSVPLTEPELEV